MQFNKLNSLILRSKISVYIPEINIFKINRKLSVFNTPKLLKSNLLNNKINDLKCFKVYSTGPKQNIKFSPKDFQPNTDRTNTKSAVWYILSGFVIMIGASYAAVPLFKLFCESQGIDTNTDFRDLNFETLKSKLKTMKRIEDRNIAVKFIASTSSDLQWTFEPSQSEIVLAPGETALAFFKAKNLTNRSIVGIGKTLY